MKITKHLAMCASVMALGACSGGGNSAGNLAGTPAVTTPAIPSVTLGPITSIQAPATPLLANGTTPSFSTQLIPGTVFPLTQSVLVLTNNAVTDFNGGAGATLTLVGVKNSDGTITSTGAGTSVYQLSVPGLSLGSDVQLPSDGSRINLSNGGSAAAFVSALSYTHFGTWLYTPGGSGPAYQGFQVSGYQTSVGAVPASGSATYAGNGTSGGGAVTGFVFVPDGSGSIAFASLLGKASVNVNFSSGVVSGSLTGITSTTGSGSTPVAWNDVSLTGNLSGATLSGNTAVGGSAAGSGGFTLSTAATGKFSGALYGPNGQELGAVWTLNEPNSVNGKTATGTIAAIKGP